VTLYLIRHPQPEIPPGICYGRFDIDLKPGVLEHSVNSLADALPRGLPCISSPALRCRRLSEALLARSLIRDLNHDARLLEMDFGRWEGRSWDDIGEAEVGAWAANILDGRAPGGESARELIARIGAFRAEWQGRDAVAVTHAGPIRTLLHLCSGQPEQDWRWDQPALAYGSISRID